MAYNGKLPGKDEIANLIIGALRQDKKDVVINAEIQAEIDQTSFRVAEEQIDKLAKPRKVDVDTSKAEQKIKRLMDPLRDVEKEIKSLSGTGSSFNIAHNTIKRYEQLKNAVSEVANVLGENNQELRDACDIIRYLDNVIKNLDITVEKATKKRKSKSAKKQTDEIKAQADAINEQTDAVIKHGAAVENMISSTEEQIAVQQQQIKVTESATKAQKKLQEEYKSTEKIINESAKKHLGNNWINKIYGSKNSDEAKRVLDEIDEKIKTLEADAHDAKIGFDSLNVAIQSYTGSSLKKKSDFQNAIKDAWRSGETEMAAKLFSTYKERFPDGKFDPDKIFGSEWTNNFTKNLESANRSLSIWRAGIRSAAEEYGKFVAYNSLTKPYNPEAGTMGYKHMAESHMLRLLDQEKKSLEVQEKQIILEQQMHSRFDVDDKIVAYKNLCDVVDEYNSILNETNRLIEYRDKFTQPETYEDEAWSLNEFERINVDGKYDSLASYLMHISRQIGETIDKAEELKVGLTYALRVYRELGGTEIPNLEESLLKEIDSPIKQRVVEVQQLTSSYEGLADAVERYVSSSKKLWDAYDNNQDFNAFAEERNSAIEEIVKHFPLDAPGVDASLLSDGYRMMLQSYDMSRTYANDGAESMLRAVETSIQNARDQMVAEQQRLAEVNKQVTETAKLIASLQEKYRSDKANKIFGDTISSYSKYGGLNVHTAKDMYDALIAKEQEYLAEIKKRQDTLNEFNRINQGVLELHYDSEGIQMKAGELAARIIDGKLTQADATKELSEYIEETIEKEAELKKTVENTTSAMKEQKSVLKGGSSTTAVNDISQMVPRDVLDKILSGVDVDGLIGSYGLSGDKLTHGIDLLKDFASAVYLGDASPKSSSSIFDELFNFVVENAQHTEEVIKTLQDFRERMKLVQIRIPENMERAFAADFVDVWSDFKKLYAIGGNSKNKTKLLTTSKYASTPDVLIQELIDEGFGSAFNAGDMKDFNGSAQDALRMIVDAVQRAKAEFKFPNVQTIFGLDEEGQADFVQRFSKIADIVYKNVRDVNATIMNDLSDSIEQQADGEKRLAEAADATAQAKKRQADAAQDAVSVEEIIAKDVSDALEKLRSSKNNETTLFSLKGVFEGEDLVTQAQEMVENIAKQANLTLSSFNVKDDTIKVKLYNDELKVTVDQMYKLRAAAEDAESATLELTSQSFTQNVKALNENTFDTEGMQQRALAAVEKVRSGLHGLEYDLTDIESVAKNIASQDDFTRFNNQLRAIQDNIQAIKNSTVSKNSMNPLANMQRDMKNANIEIETMRLKLEKFGNINGVDEATRMLTDMADAAKQYQQATDAQGQQAAYNQYSSLSSSLKAQFEYINAAKSLRESQESSAKQLDPIKDQYKSILDTITKINSVNSDILKYQDKDGGSGLFAGYIKQLQTDKSQLISQLQGVIQEINSTLSGAFVQGKEYSLPFAKLLSDDDWISVSSFLNNTKTQASLTTEEIEKLVAALQKSQTIDVESAAKVAEKFKSVQETYKQLNSLSNIDKNNVNYQAIAGMFADIMKYKAMLSDDPTQWSAQENANLQRLIDNFNQYGNILAQVGQKEEKYFADKTKYTQDTTMSRMAEDAEKSAEQIDTAQQKLTNAAKEFAQESGSDALITNFTKTADGISRLDFSVFDTATGSLRNFRMEMGSVTEGMFITETTVSKSLSNLQTAQKQLQSINGLLGRLGVSGVNIDGDNSSEQVQRLLSLSQQLSAEINKGGDADQNIIAKLIKDSKFAASEVEKLYKQMLQMESLIANGQVTNLGVGNPMGDVYGQLASEAQKLAETHQGATLEFGRFDQATNTLNASLVYANGTVESFKLQMNGLNGQMTSQQAGVSKLTTSWDNFKTSLASIGKQLMTALVGANLFYKAISEVRKGIGYVKEIDLALTELKKVTDETEASYRKFLQTAAQTAGEIGSTVSDFTEATANFARLNI